MAGKRNEHTFTKGDPRAIAAGRKSKRGPLMRTGLQKILEMAVVPKGVDRLMKQLGLKQNPENIAMALNMVLVAQGLNGNMSAIKEINERIDGRVGLTLEEDETEVSLIFTIKKDGHAAAQDRKAAAIARLDGKKPPKPKATKKKKAVAKKTRKRTTKKKSKRKKK